MSDNVYRYHDDRFMTYSTYDIKESKGRNAPPCLENKKIVKVTERTINLTGGKQQLPRTFKVKWKNPEHDGFVSNCVVTVKTERAPSTIDTKRYQPTLSLVSNRMYVRQVDWSQYLANGAVIARVTGDCAANIQTKYYVVHACICKRYATTSDPNVNGAVSVDAYQKSNTQPYVGEGRKAMCGMFSVHPVKETQAFSNSSVTGSLSTEAIFPPLGRKRLSRQSTKLMIDDRLTAIDLLPSLPSHVAKQDEKSEEKPITYEPPKIATVVVHPLVLLSVVDHYNRSGKVTSGQKRVVGVLLGEQRGTTLDVSNCFAVPFEEDKSDSNVWFLDHDYLENMFSMFEKVNARERIVGWYHSGPKLCANDITINELFRKFAPNSVLVVVDVRRKESDGLPTEAYTAVDEVHDDGSPTTKTFDRLHSQIGAEEAEEVGIEHLLRDIKDTTMGPLSQRIGAQLDGLSGLLRHLREIGSYLELVATNQLPINHNVIYQLQDMFNLLPDLRLHDMVRAVHVNTNDQMLIIYVAAIMRAILALHDLISNKLANRESERNEEAGGVSAVTDTKKTSGTGDQAKRDGEKTEDVDISKAGESTSKPGASGSDSTKPKK
ncbi:26S proteasome regulatory subunit N8 [Clonorchis sinensis]|uniref:26S proteasome regulatory subunit N8 n=1 Tax=Clonorchis sinensis TaxID=79923 RepID=G7YCZ7_CLOSI|nr:26S proteasome regulatory subunit N8 [Clonorchis sinensis]